MTSIPVPNAASPWYRPPDEPIQARRRIIRGTCYYPTFNHAARYYKAAHGLKEWMDAVDMVRHRLARGEIHIGRPPGVPQEQLMLLDGNTRWGVIEHDT